MKYNTVIGLETHVELSTKSKIFCSCPTDFGGAPNSHCCPVCTGEPGSLPILNKKVLDYAIKAGIATNCTIANLTHMDRKNYVYPDLPKAYQISQFEAPICEHGFVELDSGKKIGITRIHIEEDAGKLIHKGGYTYVDYNRGGVPLIEIVSDPDISNMEEAREYVEKLQLILRHIDVSDCKMQEGSMRCDVNISLNLPTDKEYGTRAEIKNMNSLTFMEKAIEYEYARQSDLLDSGEKVFQETRRYKENLGITESMRSKEDSQDYRYFREPDILSVTVDDTYIDSIRQSMPELPSVKISRYMDSGLSIADAKIIVKYKKVSEFFDEVVACGIQPKMVSNTILTQVFSSLSNDEEKELFNIAINSKQLADLLKLVQDNKINANMAKSTLFKMLESGSDFSKYIGAEELKGIDDDELQKLCLEAISSNARAVTDYKSGKEIALKALLGYVMKATCGKANAQAVEVTLKKLL